MEDLSCPFPPSSGGGGGGTEALLAVTRALSGCAFRLRTIVVLEAALVVWTMESRTDAKILWLLC